MLSYPQCTNQAGNIRRQPAPEVDFADNPRQITTDGASADDFSFICGSPYGSASPSRDQTPRFSQHSNRDATEQHIQPDLQGSQELNARPGYTLSTHLSKPESPQQETIRLASESSQSLSEADIDALLRGLEAEEAQANEPLPFVDGVSRDRMKLSVNDKFQHGESRFMSFERDQTKVEAEQPASRFGTPGLTALQGQLDKIEFVTSDDTDMTDEHVMQHSNIIDQHDRFPLIQEDSTATIKPRQRSFFTRETNGDSNIAHFFGAKDGSIPTLETSSNPRNLIERTDAKQVEFPDMSELKADIPEDRGGYHPSIYSPLSNSLPSHVVSLQTSPETPSMTLFEDSKVDEIILNAQRSFLQIPQYRLEMTSPSAPTQHGQHQRAKSMTDLDLEECVRDTGVTIEEIASFIQGPLPDDQKWSCLFEEIRGKPCGKRFARKENAKSHVQTHLGDRQFVCKVCQTPFVRQHDLKRHFKIHTVEKAHQCPCGKDFHRHDALTRHRQRGMCVGAFGGTAKKVIKRGRPKKARPSTEERSEKAAKTRQYVMERTKPGSTYASSISGSSEYSAPSPRDFDNLSITASSPSISHKGFDDFKFPDLRTQPLTPPASPERISDVLCLPPSAYQTASPELTRHSLSPRLCSISELPSAPMLAGPVQDNFHSSPPELDLSSSSPATSQVLDFSAFAESAGHQDQYAKVGDSLQPQIFGDFQLFAGSKRATDSVVKFEDFLDFSNIDPSTPDKDIVKAHANLLDMSHDSIFDESPGSFSDPFAKL